MLLHFWYLRYIEYIKLGPVKLGFIYILSIAPSPMLFSNDVLCNLCLRPRDIFLWLYYWLVLLLSITMLLYLSFIYYESSYSGFSFISISIFWIELLYPVTSSDISAFKKCWKGTTYCLTSSQALIKVWNISTGGNIW